MGILSSLLGTSKPDYSQLVKNVASAGGKGIIKTKYESLANYFQKHGEVIQSAPDMLNARFKTSENNYAVLLERERSGGRDTGRTIISVNAEIPINWNDPRIGDVLTYAYKPFIKSRDDAENVVHAIYMHGQSQFIYDTKAGGEMKQGANSSATAPASLKAFIDKFPEDHRYNVNHDVIMLTEQITREAGETELQVKVIYSIADAIVREHRLLS